MSIYVRPGTPEDVEWMLDQAGAFNEFIGTRHSLFPDRERGRTFLLNFLERQPVYIADSRGTPVGFMLLLLHPHLFNPDVLVLTELLWWVQPEYRATRAAALLLLAFEQAGERLGVDWMVMTLEAKSPLNPDALEKRGYRLHERSYLREMPTLRRE